METVTLGNGRTVLIRPIEAGDKQRMVEAFERLSPESRYRRFFAPMHELSAEQLAYLTEVDHRDHEALVALDESGSQGLGVARYVRDAEDRTIAEVAVTVVDDWQRMGIGTLLAARLAERAREEGITHFSALVQADNRLVLDMVRSLGEVRSQSEGSELLLDVALPDAAETRRRIRAVLREAAESRVNVRRRPAGAAPW